MAYTEIDFPSGAAVKRAVAAGETVRLTNNSPFADDAHHTGRIAVEGPHYPKPHTWWITVEAVNGVIVKVCK